MQAGRIVARAPANPTHLWCPRIPLPHAPPASTCAPPLLPAPGLGSSLGQFMQPLSDSVMSNVWAKPCIGGGGAVGEGGGHPSSE